MRTTGLHCRLNCSGSVLPKSSNKTSSHHHGGKKQSYLETRKGSVRGGHPAPGNSCDMHAIGLSQASTCLADAAIPNDAHLSVPVANANMSISTLWCCAPLHSCWRLQPCCDIISIAAISAAPISQMTFAAALRWDKTHCFADVFCFEQQHSPFPFPLVPAPSA